MSLALGDSLVHGPRAFVGASSLGVWTKAAPCCVLGLQSVGVPWAHTCQQVLGAAAQVCWDGVWAAAAYGPRQPDGSRAPCLGALASPAGSALRALVPLSSQGLRARRVVTVRSAPAPASELERGIKGPLVH